MTPKLGRGGGCLEEGEVTWIARDAGGVNE